MTGIVHSHMKTSLFISDLHLQPGIPQTQRLFERFIDEKAADADQLFILGDLFEYWLGDDAIAHSGYQGVVDKLASLAESKTSIYFMHGNRDFLVGEDFAAKIGGKLLADPTLLSLGSCEVLLMHGDSLCTDDIEHQKFRAISRSSEWQEDILAKSIAERQAIADNLRMTSKQGYVEKSDEIMDVNRDSVCQVMDEQEVDILIHGHTHRMAIHNFTLGKRSGHRIVLGDWHEDGNYLCHDDTGFRLINYPDESLVAAFETATDEASYLTHQA